MPTPPNIATLDPGVIMPIAAPTPKTSKYTADDATSAFAAFLQLHIPEVSLLLKVILLCFGMEYKSRPPMLFGDHSWKELSAIESVPIIISFLRAFESRDLAEISETEVENFINRYRSEKQISESYESHMLTAVKKLYLLVFNKDIELKKLSKNHLKNILPSYLTNHEIQRMITFSTSSKNRCVIALLYSAGLRVVELINLKNSSIDFTRDQILIIHPRTKKQRSLPLSSSLIPYLKSYLRCYSNDHLVFTGYKNGPLRPRTVQKIVEKSAIATGRKERVAPTMLRNSFAIHLLQAGTRPEIVQQLLGLDSEQSMQKYIIAANREDYKFNSPLN